MAEIIDRLKGSLSDRYRIDRELGRGGMATVYLAVDVRHDREVAIKVLHPELSATIGGDRFEREIKLAAKLQHPHILGLHDSGVADGLLFYVMPFVQGESLRDRLDREKQLPIEDALQITLEVADALGYAHGQDIIHRDIKPENILLANGHALLADFGIARARTEAANEKLTQTGMSVGTASYMSPEQATGEQVGPSTDIYSLGCVLYEMLAGEPPFSGANSAAIIARHVMEQVPLVRIVRPSVPEEVEEAILAAMEKSPADRPRTAADFSEALGVPLGATATRRAAMRATGTRRVPTAMHPVPELPVPMWRRPIVFGGALAVVAAVAVVAALTLRGGGNSGATLDPRARTVAVLYFSDESRSGDLGPVADRITESLISELERIPQLTVVSRNGVAAFRGSELARDSIARSVAAGTLVEGTVESESGNRVRITTRLYDGSGANLGRTENVLVSADSLFSAEASVARKVGEMLRQQLGPEIALREKQSGTASNVAWTLYNRAERTRKDAEALSTTSRDSARAVVLMADSLARAAIESDSRWLEPRLLRGELALSRARLTTDRAEQSALLDTALIRADEAVSEAAGNARALALRGTIRFAKSRDRTLTDQTVRDAHLDAAQKDLQDATQLDGTLASAYATLSNLYYDRKSVTDALSYARRAYDTDRFLTNTDGILLRLFWTSYDTDLIGDARKWCDEGYGRFPGNYAFAACHIWLMLHPEVERSIPEAWRWQRAVDSLAPATSRPPQSLVAQMVVGGVIGLVGRGAASQADRNALMDSAKRVLERSRGDRTLDPTRELLGYEAIMRAQMGDSTTAISQLKEYVAANPGHSFQVGANVHWWWRELKDNPAFAPLMQRGR